MTISLITATLGRTKEIRTLCESLVLQDFKDFDLYIVDQNSHNLVEEIINDFKHILNIHYIRSNIKGLSINRNIALKVANGDLLGFPDDDCFYAPNTLSEVIKTFKTYPEAIFVATSTYDTETKKRVHFTNKKKILKKDIISTCISYNIFAHKNQILFDERLGVGSYFSSGEETDYLYSLIESPNSYGIFCKEASVFHPQAPKETLNEKVYKYSLGFGALQKKDWIQRHNLHALRIFLYYLLRAICGMLFLKNFNRHWKSFSGKITGFIKFKV